jgi:hypothetical protein
MEEGDDGSPGVEAERIWRDLLATAICLLMEATLVPSSGWPLHGCLRTGNPRTITLRKRHGCDPVACLSSVNSGHFV